MGLAALGVLLTASAAPAADRYWVYTGTTGWWNNAAYWSSTPGGPGGAGQPRTGDKAWLTQSSTANRWVYFYTNYPADNYDTIQVYSSGSGSMTFYVGVGSYNQTLRANQLIVGGTSSLGKGVFRQDGWTTTLSDRLRLSNGSLFLNGGSFSAPLEYIGIQSTGTFKQTGGTNAVGNLLEVGDIGGGTYELSGGSVTAPTTAVGDWGYGTFKHSGGTHTVTSLLALGRNASYSNGTYELSNTGYLSTPITQVGVAGTGLFKQTGGTHAIGDVMEVGVNSGVHGTYELGPFGRLTAARGWIGKAGLGTFKQDGGTATYSGDLEIGNNNGSGTYELHYGSVEAQNLKLGPFGVGNFIQTHGTATVDQTLQVSSGWYQMSGGSLSTAESRIGYYSGTGTFTQTGGYHRVYNTLTVGYDRPGTYCLEDEDYSSWLITNATDVGLSANGLFEHSMTTHDTSTTLRLGVNAGIKGEYRLSGGQLITRRDQIVGVAGNGVFQHSGGTNRVDNQLILGFASGSSGSYALSGTGSLTALTEVIGQSGTGTFTQSGGTNQVSGNLQLATAAGVTATYDLSGGSLSAYNLRLGYGGKGSLTQTGGTATVANELTLGMNAGSTGAYELKSGSLTALTEVIGQSGTGTFTQTGGSHTVTSAMTLAALKGSRGTYNMKGGDLNVNNLTVQPKGVFNYESGSVTIADLYNYGSISVAEMGTLTVNGAGLFNQGTFTLNGGELILNGSHNYSTNDKIIRGYGTISGAAYFTNTGNFIQEGGDLTLTVATANYGVLTLAPDKFLTLGSLANYGLLNLNGAFVNGAYGELYNQPGGLITGSGNISTAFTNWGSVVLQPWNNINLSIGGQNQGLIQLTHATARLGGGWLTNSGTIEGVGLVANYVSNTGTVEALGGTLLLSGGLSNEPSGLLRAAAGSKLLITAYSSGHATINNFGTISLMGGTLDTAGRTLTNLAQTGGSYTTGGQISGYGIISTGTLYNQGTMTLAGGPTTVNGPVINMYAQEEGPPQGEMYLQHPCVFTGLVTNYGYIKVNGLPNNNQAYVFAGGLANWGTFESDPAVNVFKDLTLKATGALRGGAGDRFLVQNDFLNQSTNSSRWNTQAAELAFIMGSDASHNFSLAGADLGAKKAGFLNNFAWGSLTLETGQFLNLLDGNDIPGGALYVGEILGLAIDWQGLLITNITGHGLNIYYDPLDPENAYLKGQTFDFLNGGHLAPAVVPLPGSVWLLFTGVAGVLGLRARRRF